MSRRTSNLTREDWDRINEKADEVIEGGLGQREGASAAIAGWREDEAEGDDQAERIVTELGTLGMVKAIKDRGRQDSGVVIEESTGRVLAMPKRASVPMRDASGATNGARQLAYWRSLDRNEFTAWAASQQRLAASLRLKTRGIAKVLQAWERHPDAATAEAACLLAGLDPDSLDLDLAV